MHDIVIRGKAVSLALFVLMICLSIYFQRQELAAAGAQPDGRIADARDAVRSTDARDTGTQLGDRMADARDAARSTDARDTGVQPDDRIADARDAAQTTNMRDTGMRDTGARDTARTTGARPADPAAELPARVALTFDDGPHPVYTKILLDGLRERGVKATFFVIGENIPGHEDLIRKMAEDGHIIGNHTYDHVDISSLSREDACEELQKTCDLVEKITGSPTAYVRAPYGKWDDALDACVTMIPVRWTIDPLDWTTKNQEQTVNQVIAEAGDGDIILLHDYYEPSVRAALEIVDILQEKGFEFVTVEELLLE